jgi:hypothetical protein
MAFYNVRSTGIPVRRSLVAEHHQKCRPNSQMRATKLTDEFCRRGGVLQMYRVRTGVAMMVALIHDVGMALPPTIAKHVAWSLLCRWVQVMLTYLCHKRTKLR